MAYKTSDNVKYTNRPAALAHEARMKARKSKIKRSEKSAAQSGNTTERVNPSVVGNI